MREEDYEVGLTTLVGGAANSSFPGGQHNIFEKLGVRRVEFG